MGFSIAQDLLEKGYEVAIKDITAALEAGVLRYNIAQTFPLTQLAAAREAQDSSKMIGKAIVEIS